MIQLKCDCCGHEEVFADGEHAFYSGWDAEPHFSGYTTCNLCPASTQFMPGGWERHASVHERWAQEGRPEVFDQETCLDPDDRVDPEKIEAVRKLQEALGKEGFAELKQTLIEGLKDR